MREQVIEDAVVTFAEGCGWLARKMSYTGRRGCPDHWFFKGARQIIIEFKKPGEKPDGVQLREHTRLHEHGFKVCVIDNIEAGKRLFTDA
ncbi:MAG TPA: hypothetical protein VGL66_19695 [Caulobacteraceae bacterium]